MMRFLFNALLGILISVSCYSQSITGVVTSDAEGGLPGATVTIKGTSVGTVTDIQGRYSLEVREGDVLVYSFVGYRSSEVVVSGQTVINVSLEFDVEALDEVIVVGYGTSTKSDITGSVASLKPKEITNIPISRTDQALQGRVAGVNIQNNNASPNAETRIRIRGSNSLLGNNNPLIVIDGIQDGSLNLVHPSDIKSIEVLKDASALAIYGAKGANGAILITTKNASEKEGITVNYSNYVARHSVRNKLDVLNAAQYAQRQNQDALELGGIPPFSQEDIANFQQNGGTDWQDEIFRTVIAQNHHLSLSGNSEKVQFAISGDALQQDGIIRGSEFDRYSFRGNLSLTPQERWEVNINTFLSRTKDSPIALNSFSGENAGSPVNSAILWSPTDPVFEDPINRVYTLPGFDTDVGPLTDFNPVALAVEPIREHIQLNTLVNTQLAYEVLDGLKLSVRGGIRIQDNENSEFINNKPTQVEDSESASIYNSRNLFAQISYLANYSFNDGNGHNLNFTGLFEEQYNEFNDSWLGARGFVSDAVTFDNLGLGQDVFPLSSSRSKRTLRSYMARTNYNYKGRYLLTINARWDASSVFGSENKWAFFPSLALGWNISDEVFMQDLKETISDLKFRVSYGLTGSQAIPPGGSIGLIGDNFTYPIDGNQVRPGIGIADRAPNPNLKWETTKQLNAGVDMELFEGRINASFDYYIKETTDLLFERPIAQASGSSTQFVNVGAIENKGIDLFVEGTPMDGKVKWVTNLTFSRNRNTVLELLDNNSELPIGSVGFPGFTNFIWLQVGQPVGQFRGVKFDGIWQANEAEEAELYGAIPGSPKAVDQNNDNVINEEDVIVLGNSQPDFTYGWNNTFTFKGIDLNIFVQGVQGIEKLNLSRLQLLRGTGAELLNRWTPTNPDTDVPSRIGEATYSIGNSDRFIEDASYIRVKNISLGYNFSNDLIAQWGLSKVHIYVSAYNLITFTDYSGYDPESTVSGADFSSGVDLATFPEQKIFTAGLNVSF